MGKRRWARECALQCLYQWDITGSRPEEVLAGYWASRRAPESVRRFTERLVLGTAGRVAELDELIGQQAEHWRLDRIGRVERGILRMGLYELLYEPETPAAVAIDEAIELAKRYCGPAAGPFINGILDGVRRRLAEGTLAPEATGEPTG